MTDQHQAASAEPFELSGGALCLDFANTWGNHADPRSDRLRDYGRFLAFAEQTGVLGGEAVAELGRRARERPDEARDALRRAKELRGVTFRVFSARAAGQELPGTDIGRLNDVLGEALSHRVLCCRDEVVEWDWCPTDTEDPLAPLWPILGSAATLLTSDDLGRVSECDADDCNWLFIDRSRSRSRRWCSMESCGNRAKARRHYRRHQKD